MLRNALLGLFLVFLLAACNKDDDDMPQTSEATFEVTIENVLPVSPYLEAGTMDAIPPGESREITFHAGAGSYLNFATMFVQSNDLFYAFDQTGYQLYDDNNQPKTGDITGSVDLWDAGTEVNEEPGEGPNQAPRQDGPDTGLDENGVVDRITNINDGFTYPADEDILQLSLAHDGETMFTLTIENVSNTSSLATPLAPGVWVVHGADEQLFTTGEPAPEGLEPLAEDGGNTALGDMLIEGSQYTSPLAPGVWVVHDGSSAPIFEDGQADYGEGLEALAEDGDPAGLNDALSGKTGVSANGVFNTPEGASDPGPLLPGSTYSFTFDAEEGDYLNFATMLVQTNDLFYAFDSKGIALFTNGMAINGDQTMQVLLWDAGTEVNEYPGAGNNQPVRGGADSGPDENSVVMEVNDSFTYPPVSEAVKVTITVIQ